MASKALAHLRRQWMGALSLFLVLSGGVTYAATGDTFILGQGNSASKSTRLSSGVAGDALRVTSTTGSGGRAIGGFSDAGQGVYGHSNSNAGLVGESLNFDGIFGVSHSPTHAAVSAHNDLEGFGLWAEGGSQHNNTAAVHGQSAAGNAVEGFSAAPVGSGVYGQDNNANSYGVAGHSDNGVAVVGDSSSGWAMQALGNTTQTRAKGGLVKAMVYVDYLDHAADPIRQCFNSQLPPGQATSQDCGITVHKDSCCTTGAYDLDFNFRVDDRFILGTASGGDLSAEIDIPPNFFNDQVGVGLTTPTEADRPFWLIVF
jgi:hypothetical protein